MTSKQEVAQQMAIAAEFSDGFLNLKSGDIYRMHEYEPGSEYLPLIQSGQLQLIPTITSQDLYLWMKEFASTVSSPIMRQELNTALEKIGGVWKFRNILYHEPELERKWEFFQKKKLLAIATEWIESLRESLNVPDLPR